MKTTVISKSAVQGNGLAKAAAAKEINAPVTGKSANETIQTSKANDSLPVPVKNETAITEVGTISSVAAVGEEAKSAKVKLNLDATLKVVEDLHRRSLQRDNLIKRLNELESFEITLMEEGDELERNHFQGCKLAIIDDSGRQFVTFTAGLIKLTAEFIKQACKEKLGEIEAQIVFP